MNIARIGLDGDFTASALDQNRAAIGDGGANSKSHRWAFHRLAPYRLAKGMADTERSLALFIDFENLALGFQGARGRFDIGRVLKRMVEKGKIVAK